MWQSSVALQKKTGTDRGESTNTIPASLHSLDVPTILSVDVSLSQSLKRDTCCTFIHVTINPHTNFSPILRRTARQLHRLLSAWTSHNRVSVTESRVLHVHPCDEYSSQNLKYPNLRRTAAVTTTPSVDVSRSCELDPFKHLQCNFKHLHACDL
jgi:hypothetical protein